MESIDTARGRKESGRLAVSAKEEALGFTALAITLLSLINSLILPRGMQSRIYEYITQEKKKSTTKKRTTYSCYKSTGKERRRTMKGKAHPSEQNQDLRVSKRITFPWQSYPLSPGGLV